MTNKIQVETITFEWSESNQVTDGTTVKTFEEAEQIIFNIALHNQYEGYDKTKFTINWVDGHSYTGRIDVLSSYTSGKELRNHIENHCLYFAGERKGYHPNDEEYQNSLKAYGVNEEEQKEYRAFLDTYNLIDVPEVAEEVSEVATNESSTYYKLNSEKNGVEIYFDDKPSEEVRNVLKSNGFRWAKYNKCWYAKQSETTLAIAEQMASSKQAETSSNEVVSYPEINIDDVETYTISEQLQKAEHDSAWVFRKGERDHNKELQSLFTSYNNKTIEVLEKMENEYYIFKVKTALQSFKKKYHEAYIKYLSHKANNPSWAVTGRGGMNVNKYNKAMDRQTTLMLVLAEMPKELDELLMSYKLKERKDKQNIIKEAAKNTEINITFKTETKEFRYMRMDEKKRVYVYNEYWICKLWGCFRIFKGNGENEIYSMKTTEKLDDAKKYVTMLVNEKEMKTA